MNARVNPPRRWRVSGEIVRVGFICPRRAIVAGADPWARACVDMQVFFPVSSQAPGCSAQQGTATAPVENDRCEREEDVRRVKSWRCGICVARDADASQLPYGSGRQPCWIGMGDDESLPGCTDPDVTGRDTFRNKGQCVQHAALPFQRRATMWCGCEQGSSLLAVAHNRRSVKSDLSEGKYLWERRAQ